MYYTNPTSDNIEYYYLLINSYIVYVYMTEKVARARPNGDSEKRDTLGLGEMNK